MSQFGRFVPGHRYSELPNAALGNKGSRIERDHKSERETDELGEIV